jgi:hypothetical protein
LNTQSMLLMHSSPEDADLLRQKWAAEQNRIFDPTQEFKKVSAPMTTATSTNYLDKLVSKRIEAIKTERERIADEAAKARNRAIELAEQELERKFADFIRREIGTVSDGALHFQYSGESYSVALTGGAYVLSGATIRDTKIEGPSGNIEENLVNTSANLKLSDRASQPVAPVVTPEQIELDRLRGVSKRYVSALDELKKVF